MTRFLFLNWKHPADPSAGGAEQYVARVAATWAEAGHQVDALVPDPPRDPGAVGREDSVHWLPSGSRRGIFGHARRHLARHGDSYDAVIESVSTRPFFSHELVGDRATMLYMQVADDVWHREYRFPVSAVGRYLIEPAWLRRASGARIVAISQSTSDDLRRHGVSTLAIVPPGCDSPLSIAPRDRPSEHPRLVFIGRLVNAKRPQEALDAFSRICRRFPNAVLHVMGRGYLENELRRRAVSGVHVHGFVSGAVKAALLSEADLVLLPGTREGWGIVAMEAAGHGVPVVAYDIGGFRDSVVHGSTGLLTAPNPGALADGAIALLSDTTRWQQMRSAARQRALGFSWSQTADRLLGIVAERLPRYKEGAA